MARGSIQSEFAADQLLVNLKLAADRNETGWEQARREEADRLGQTIARAPYRVSRMLGRSKFGALYLMDRDNLGKFQPGAPANPPM